MSYCRFGKDSQVYAFATDKTWEMYVNRNPEDATEHLSFKSLKEFFDSLNLLKSEGIAVPKHTFDRIKIELKTTGAWT